jgi:hypothetical protein
LDAGRFCRSPSACRAERSRERGSAVRAFARRRTLLSTRGFAGGHEEIISANRSVQVHPRRVRQAFEQRAGGSTHRLVNQV